MTYELELIFYAGGDNDAAAWENTMCDMSLLAKTIFVRSGDQSLFTRSDHLFPVL